MLIKDRLFIGKILIDEFERLIEDHDPYDHKTSEIIRRASMILIKMQRIYEKWDEPPELLEQIEQMELIIKRLEEMQNR